MPFDPDAEPSLNARVLLAEHGDDAVEEIWWLAQLAERDGRRRELPKLLAALRAIYDGPAPLGQRSRTGPSC